MKTTSSSSAIAQLKQGHNRSHTQESRSAGTNKPYAVVLTCIDARLAVEAIFDASVGELFVARVAGNTVNAEILGSLEYACAHAGAGAILVLGHTECKAIESAMNHEGGSPDPSDNLGRLLQNFKVSVAATKVSGGSSDDCAQLNVQDVIERIRRESPTLNSLEESGDITITGGMYDIETDKVTFF